ncbi:MAG: ROK family protein, partial [Clostridia bacterium]|nr:ROK family protein [Clostridia bacterium]
GNIDVKSGKCACGNSSCLERLIRIKVFNSNSIEDFTKKTTVQHLQEFTMLHPYRYKVLKHLIAHALCIVTNTLNVDLIIFSGRILNEIPQLKKDMSGLMSKFSLTASAKYCNIVDSSGDESSVAIGASIMAYYNIYSDSYKEFYINWL